MSEPCPFCDIVAGHAPATIVKEWTNALAIVPLNPVTQGHILVLPKVHLTDFTDDPLAASLTSYRAGQLGKQLDGPFNLITSKGEEATQSVFHLHYHLVPRAANDGLALPWYSGRTR